MEEERGSDNTLGEGGFARFNVHSVERESPDSEDRESEGVVQ